MNTIAGQRPSGGWWVRLSGICLGFGILSGAWVLAGLTTWHRAPNTALTTVFFLLAVAACRCAPARYKWGIACGLGASAFGDFFLLLPDRFFVAGLGSFLVGHLFYLWAFTSDTPIFRRKAPFVVFCLPGIVLLICLWPDLPATLRLPVIVYTAALLGMAAQASARALSIRTLAAGAAAVGAGLFVVSDSVLAWQRFRGPIEAGRLVVLSTYFAAQTGIALSSMLKHNRLSQEPASVPGRSLAETGYK